MAAVSNNQKGYKCLKSSPLATTSSKLTSQYMVLDHMRVHYNKILKAKSAIDAGTPKSMQTSQKARDTLLRSGSAVPGHGLYKTKTPRKTTPRGIQTYNQEYLDQLEFDDDPEINSIIQETLLGAGPATDSNFESNKATYQSSRTSRGAVRADVVRRELLQDQQRREALGNTQMTRAASANAFYGSLGDLSARGTHKRGSADLLDQHAHKFKQADKPFTPRTLRTNREVKSKLSESKCYTAPRRQQSAGAVRASAQAPSHKPQPSPRKKERSVNDTVTMDPEGLTLMSRDGSRVDRIHSPSVVPRLDITTDKDNAKWLAEQANKAQIRKSLVAVQSKSPRHSGSSLSRTIDEDEFSTIKSYTEEQIDDLDEESKYMEFMNDVLTDVNNRGIVTNRVLKRVFEQHVERRRKELDVRKMRNCLQKLREKLDITGADHGIESEMLGQSGTLEDSGLHTYKSVRSGASNGRSNEHMRNASNSSLAANSEERIASRVRSRASFSSNASLTQVTEMPTGQKSQDDTLTHVTGEMDTLKLDTRRPSLGDTVDADDAGVMAGYTDLLEDRSEVSSSTAADIGRREIDPHTTPLQMTLSPAALRTQFHDSDSGESHRTRDLDSVTSSNRETQRQKEEEATPTPRAAPRQRGEGNTRSFARQENTRSLTYSDDFEEETIGHGTLDYGDTFRDVDTIFKDNTSTGTAEKFPTGTAQWSKHSKAPPALDSDEDF